MGKRIKFDTDDNRMDTDKISFTIEDLERIDMGDVELVMSQCNCEYKVALIALLKHDGDIVNTIMDLNDMN